VIDMGAGRVPASPGVADGGVVANTPAPQATTLSSVAMSFEEFRQAVLERQIAWAQGKGKSYFAPVPKKELEIVEGDHRMRKDAAKACRELLAAARAALAEDTASGEARALKTRSIGVCSAYRDFNRDARAWGKTFKKHYDKMIERGKFEGREHSSAALRHMVTTMIPLKAAPGFSNHSNGTAVDFQTRFGGTEYIADSSQREGWCTTWLHPWLVAHAAEFGFRPLKSEEWHWDH
jgi:hypothetical protein